MRAKKIVLTGLCALSLASLLAACGAASRDFDRAEQPEWTNRQAGPVMEDGRRIFYSVGMVTGIKNTALARSTAENRARAEMQKFFDTYSATLMKDYQASTTAGDMEASSEEQHVEQAVKTFSAGSLSGVAIVDRWRDRETNTVFALARLDLAAVEDLVTKMKQLSPKIRDYVRKNAARVHDELRTEEERQGAVR